LWQPFKEKRNPEVQMVVIAQMVAIIDVNFGSSFVGSGKNHL